MRAKGRRLVPAVALVLAATGCAANPAPEGWLAAPAASAADPYGAWIVLELHRQATPVSGEFLAVHEDSVYVLEPVGAVRGFHRDSVRAATIAFYNAQPGQLAGWAALGSLSTVSHGAFLILSLPTWLIAGSLATSAQSRAPLHRVEAPGQWEAVRLYARFPAGLPPGLPDRLPVKARGG
jgi:hypothetical protein